MGVGSRCVASLCVVGLFAFCGTHCEVLTDNFNVKSLRAEESR